MKGGTLKSRNLAYWGLLAWIAAVYTVVQWRYPLIFDDLGFMTLYRDMAGNDSFSLKAIAKYYDWIRIHDNGRLANLLAPFSTLFTPFRELFPLLSGIFVALIIALTRKMAGFRHSPSSPLFPLSLAWILILLFLPWRDFIFSADFALNYIWGGAITLSFLYLIVRKELRGWSPRAFLWMIPLATIAGGWHEGFTVPAVIGLAVWTAFRRGKMTAFFFVLIATYAISAFIFLYCPGTSSRFGSYIFSGWPSITDIKFIWQISPFIILLISAVSALAWRSRRSGLWREFFRNPFCWIGIGIIISAYGIDIMLNATPRAYLWPGIFCIILSLALLLPIFQWILSEKASYFIAVAFIALCSLQNVAVIYWMDRYRRENDTIVGQLQRQKVGTVFHDVIQPWDLPPYTLNIPPRTLWTSTTNYGYLQRYYDGQFIGVVPEALAKADISTGVPLKGNLNARRLDGHIVAPYQWASGAPDNIVRPYYVELQYTDHNGRHQAEAVLETAFITLPFKHFDGQVKSDTLMYYRLHPSDIPDISEVSIINPRRW